MDIFQLHIDTGGTYSFFYVYSVINGIRYSFTDWDGMSTTFNLVGFKNYISLFKNPNFWGSLKTTVCYSILLVAGVVTLSLALSLSLNSLKRFKTFTKSVFFVPAMIGGITIALSGTSFFTEWFLWWDRLLALGGCHKAFS